MKCTRFAIRRATLIVGLALACSCTARPPNNGCIALNSNARLEQKERSKWALKDEKDAISRAVKLFGISGRNSIRTEAQVVTLTEDNTPFLHDQITNRPIWRISVNNYSLRLKSAPANEKDRYERFFDILLDPQNGKLLKIVSRWPEGSKESAPEPPAAFAEDRFRESGREKYHACPEAPPAISFLEALDIIYATAGDPYDAKQIVAHYVARSALGREPRDVWSINLRGIAPFGSSHPGVLVCARDHKRHIVDARTGKWLFASTSPQPEAPE